LRKRGWGASSKRKKKKKGRKGKLLPRWGEKGFALDSCKKDQTRPHRKREKALRLHDRGNWKQKGEEATTKA